MLNIVFLLLGCGEIAYDEGKEPSSETAEPSAEAAADADGDGVTIEDGDCDDEDPNISPSATDLVGDDVDQNCDGIDGMDFDQDGFASEISGGEDCDDTDPEVSPQDNDGDGASVCDGDCNDNDAALNLNDDDGDGFSSCDDDCDDNDSSTNPDAAEICDEQDNDCNGAVDDGADAPMWYLDADGDGFGNSVGGIESCTNPGADYVGVDGDCDDGEATVSPDGDEICDGLDNDCDGLTDDDDNDVDPNTQQLLYTDGDGDGYGSSSGFGFACEAGNGYADNTDDCNDSDSSVNPNATEIQQPNHRHGQHHGQQSDGEWEEHQW